MNRILAPILLLVLLSPHLHWGRGIKGQENIHLRCFVSAGAANQVASWEQDESQSLFTKYFLKAMSGDGDKKPYGNGDGKVSLKELKIHHLTNGDIEQLLSYSDFTLYFVEQFPCTFLCQFPVLRPQGFTEVFFPEICVKLPYLVSGADSLSNTL